MIVTTTATVEGRPVREYLGVVTGEAVAGTNFVSDFFAGIRDVIGGRSRSYQKQIKRAKDAAVEDLVGEAQDQGADAVVGLHIDYEVIAATDRTMMMVVATGTAVKL